MRDCSISAEELFSLNGHTVHVLAEVVFNLNGLTVQIGSEYTLIRVEEETSQKWPAELIELLVQAKKLKETYHDDGVLIPPIIRSSLKESYDELIQVGLNENPPLIIKIVKRGRKKLGFVRNLLERLHNWKEGVLRFIDNPIVPFDNNLAGVTRSRVLDCVSAIPSIRDVPISAGFSGNGIV